MKTTILILLTVSAALFAGCSEEKPRREGFERSFQQNLTDEERQNMMEERQKMTAEACQGMNEGDECTLESPRGEMTGKCSLQDDILACAMERPMRQRRE